MRGTRANEIGSQTRQILDSFQVMLESVGSDLAHVVHVNVGVEHGLVCLGCCWALMLTLLALGVGSMFWMAVLAAAIFVEKVTSIGGRASTPVALALVGVAVWVAL